MVHYRWHLLHGRLVRRSYIGRRRAGDVVHVESLPGVAARMLDPVACAGMEIGTETQPYGKCSATIWMTHLDCRAAGKYLGLSPRQQAQHNRRGWAPMRTSLPPLRMLGISSSAIRSALIPSPALLGMGQ
jgi:hypothetical protein